MHMVKGEEGLGIQVAGGRGSKRCVLGVIITHVEEGGDIHRCPTPPICFVVRVKLPLDRKSGFWVCGEQANGLVPVSGMAACVLVMSC